MFFECVSEGVLKVKYSLVCLEMLAGEREREIQIMDIDRDNVFKGAVHINYQF